MSASKHDPTRLDRATVLAAALELVDADGLEVLTMRRLASTLRVDPMTLYRFARNKDDLLDGLTAMMYDAVDIDPDVSDWQGELERFGIEWRRLLRRHPHVLPLVATRPLVVPLTRRPRSVLELTENVLTLLGRAGLSPDRAVDCYQAFVSWLVGFPLIEARVIQDRPGDPERALRLGFQHLPAGEYAHLREAADALAHDRGDHAFRLGLRALLEAYAAPERGAEAGATTP